MNFFKAETWWSLFSPRHELSCSRFKWWRLKVALRERGQNRRRESGAFLLGRRENGRARIVDFVLYDDLDPNALSTGIVHLDGRYFSDLWAICKERGLAVVADIHVHPGGAGQSDSDRAYPMISRTGHIAMILPNFAAGWQPRRQIGMYRYLGRKEWSTVPPEDRGAFFHLSLF